MYHCIFCHENSYNGTHPPHQVISMHSDKTYLSNIEEMQKDYYGTEIVEKWHLNMVHLKFIYSEKATKFGKISTVDLTGTK